MRKRRLFTDTCVNQWNREGVRLVFCSPRDLLSRRVAPPAPAVRKGPCCPYCLGLPTENPYACWPCEPTVLRPPAGASKQDADAKEETPPAEGLCGRAGDPCRAAGKAAYPAPPPSHTRACGTTATGNLWHRTKPEKIYVCLFRDCFRFCPGSFCR